MSDIQKEYDRLWHTLKDAHLMRGLEWFVEGYKRGYEEGHRVGYQKAENDEHEERKEDMEYFKEDDGVF